MRYARKSREKRETKAKSFSQQIVKSLKVAKKALGGTLYMTRVSLRVFRLIFKVKEYFPPGYIFVATYSKCHGFSGQGDTNHNNFANIRCIIMCYMPTESHSYLLYNGVSYVQMQAIYTYLYLILSPLPPSSETRCFFLPAVV